MFQEPPEHAQTPTQSTLDFTLAGLNLINQAISIYDSELRLVVCNARFLEMFDLPVTHGEAGTSFVETLRLLAARGEYGDIDNIDAYIRDREAQARDFQPHYFERQRPDGRYVSIEGHPLRQGGWVTVYTDISDIRQSEAVLKSRSVSLSEALLDRSEALARTNRELEATVLALQTAQRDLTASETRIRATTEMMPAHIARVDRDERYTYTNRRLHSIAGLAATAHAELVGMRCQDVLAPEAYDAIRPNLRRALSGEESVFEFSLDEGAHSIRCAFTPDVGADNVVNGVFVLTTDITAESRARAEMAQARRRELAAQLTRGLAHDFANLLTVILGAQGQLARLPGLPHDTHALLDDMHTAARRGGELLERLSGVATPRTLEPDVVDIPALIARLTRMVTPSLPENVELKSRVESGLELARLDPGYLQDSLLNLILNSRDVLANAGGTVTLDVRRTREQGIEFSVIDTGPGFSERALSHALEPFFTTKAATLGSGLGLSMVFDFASLSGGRVVLENVDSAGSTTGARVRIRLPDPLLIDAPVSGIVMLVDDDASLRQGIRSQLRELGCQVLEASSAEEALSLLDIAPIAALLTDLQLGGELDGAGLAMAVSERCCDNRPAICIMSALPPSDPLCVRASSAWPFLPKPFDTHQLRRALRQDSAR